MLSDEQLMIRARDLVLVMMSNASTDDISPMQWWERARSALETGAARGRTWGELVATMAKKLQVQTLRNDTASSVCSMALDGRLLARFCRIVRDQSVYIVAEAQVERMRQREEAKEVKS